MVLFRNILKKLYTKVKIEPIRRVTAAFLVYILLVTQMLTSFAAAGGANLSQADDMTHATSSDASSEREENKETITLSGKIIFMSDDLREKPQPDLRLYVNGRLKDGAVITVDKTGTYTATGSNATESDADEIAIYDDREIETLPEADENSGRNFTVWTYYVEDLPGYDMDGAPYQYGIRDEAYRGPADGYALFYADEKQELLGGEGVWEDHAVHLTYVKAGSIGGDYQGGAETAFLPEEIPLTVGTAGGDDDRWLDLAEGWIDAAAGTWTVTGALMYNPETGQPIEWRARAAAEQFSTFIYNNIEAYETEGHYVYDGGTISSGRLTAVVEGAILWEDGADQYGKRPQSSAFLKLYTETGEDITAQAELQITSKDEESWTYRIDRLPVGERYRLVQASPYYQASETELEFDGEGRPVLPEALVMQVNTRTYHGTIQWESVHPLYTFPERLDFLQVYELGKDITETVSIRLTKQGEPSVWFYAIDGLLAEGVYTIRIEPPVGYYADVAEYEIRPLGMLSQTFSSGGMIIPFKLTATGLHEITIKNDTEGVAGGQDITFTYALKENGAEYDGLYQVVDSGGAVISVERGPKVYLSKGESKTIQLEAKVDVDQVSVNSTLVKLLKREVNQAQDEFRFINTALTTELACVVWNDNHNEDGGRLYASDPGGLTSAMKLYCRTAGGGNYILVTAQNCGMLGFTQAQFAAMFVYLSDASNDTEWNYAVYGLPSHIIDSGAVTPVEYKIVTGNPDAAGRDYIYESFDKGHGSSRNDAWTTILTRQMTFHAGVQWLDGQNLNLTRMQAGGLKDTLKLWQKDTRPGSGQVQEITIPGGFQITGSQGDVWGIEIPGLTAYDETGYPYFYYLTQAQPQTGDGSALLNRDYLVASTLEYGTEYNNKAQHAAKTDGCYDGGVIKHTLKGQMKYEAGAEWRDGGRSAADRPVVTGELWRYVRGLNPADASRVRDTAVAVPRTDGAVTVSAAGLPLFDEDGQEYIYFVHESVNSSEYSSSRRNIPPYNGLAGSGEYLYNGGTAVFSLNGKTSAAVTVQWKAKAVQGHTSSATLRLQRRIAGSSDPWTSVVGQIKTVDGFTAESMTRHAAFTNLDKYDPDGYEYEYRIVEIGAGSTLGALVPSVLPGDHDETEFMLGDYRFVREYDAVNNRIVNRLIGDTCIEIDKTWNMDEADIAEDLHFHVLRDNKDICGEYLNKADPDGYSQDPNHEGGLKMTKADAAGHDIRHWNIVSDTLPRYDGEGREYTYSVSESFSRGEYYDVEITYEYGTTTVGYEHKIAKVVNSLPGGSGKELWAVKEWLDDGDSMHREPVTVALMKQDSSAPGGAVRIETKVLSDVNAWKTRFWIGGTENYDDYFVEEIKIGDQEAADYNTMKALGYDDPDQRYILTGEHIYQVMPSRLVFNEKNQRVWVADNLRVGKVHLEITKTWTDGNGSQGYAAVFQLIANGRPEPGRTVTLTESAGSRWSGAFRDLEKYDEAGAVIHYEVKEIAVIDGGNNVIPVNNDGTFELGGLRYKAELSGPRYTPGQQYHTGDLYQYDAVNYRYGTKDVVFHKLWKDYNEADGVTRPDIYLRLYRAVGTIPGDPANGEFVPALPALNQNSGYHWTFQYRNMPEYNRNGDPYIYYAIEGMPAPVSGGWEAAYYQPLQSGETIAEAAVSGREEAGAYMQENGVVANLRGGNVQIAGRKIWGSMGGLKPRDYPTITVYLSVARWNAQAGSFGSPQPIMENGKQVSRTIGPDQSGSYSGGYSFGEYPKYDPGTGEKLQYSVSEKAGTAEEPQDLNGFAWIDDSMDLVLVNTFDSKQKLIVNLEKDWQGFAGLQPAHGYPVLEFELYREMQYPLNGTFVPLDYTLEKAGASKILDMNTLAPGSAGKVTFDQADYYAPNGWPYTYYVRERIKDGAQFEVPGYLINVEDAGNISVGFVEHKGYLLQYGQPGSSNAVEGTWIFGNRYLDAKIKIKGTKTWTDKDQGWGSVAPGGTYTPDNYRPDKSRVVLNLWRRTTAGNAENLHLTAVWEDLGDDSNWNYYFKNTGSSEEFDRYNTAGVEYQYYVIEQLTGYRGSESHRIEVVGGTAAALADMKNDLETVSLLMEKKWIDSNNLFHTRPAEITVKLQRSTDGVSFEDVARNGGNTPWTETIRIDRTTTIDSVTRAIFTGLPKYELDWSRTPVDNAYQYRVVELPPDPANPGDKLHDYELPVNYTIETTAGGFKVLFENHLKHPSSTEITAKKIWADDDNRDGFRPVSVKVKLLRDGTVVDTATLVAGPTSEMNSQDRTFGPWSVTWSGWPLYKPGSAGELSVYTVEEERIPYYQEPVITEQAGQVWEITNTHKSILDLELKFVKEWVDGNDLWEMRPDHIKVQLYRKTAGGAEEKVDGQYQEVRDQSGVWSVSFTGLPYAKEGETGKVYQYYVKEDQVYGYMDTPSGKSNEVKPVIREKDPAEFDGDGNPRYDITVADMKISNCLETTKMEVLKLWDDSANKFGTRPESITVRLQRKTAGQSVYEDVIIPGTTDVWNHDINTAGAGANEYTFSALPVYKKGTDEKYEYRVVETAMTFRDSQNAKVIISLDNGDGTFAGSGGGYTIQTERNAGGKKTTIKNSLITLETRIVKQWFDNLAGYDRRSEIKSITFTLQRRLGSGAFTDLTDNNGNPVTYTMQVTNDAEQSFTYGSLPRYTYDGQEYSYRMRETYMTLTKLDGGGTNIRIDAVTLDELSGTLGIYDFETGWTAGSGTAASVTTVENTAAGRYAQAVKRWDDAANQDGRRPGSVTLELKYDGKSFSPKRLAVLDGTPDSPQGGAVGYESEPWTAVWKDLAAVHADGTPFVYTIEEVKMDGQDGTNVNGYNQDANQPEYGQPSENESEIMSVTNIRKPEVVDFKIRKFWAGDLEWLSDRPESIQVQLYKTVNSQRTAVGAPVTVKNADDGINAAWTYTWTGLPKYENTGGSSGVPGTSYEILYQAVEVIPGEGSGYEQTASGSNAIQNTMKTTELHVIKRWEDQDNCYGRRPAEITVRLQRTTDGVNWFSAGDPEVLAIGSGNQQELSFIGLPIRDKDNQKYRYRAIEIKMDGQDVIGGRALGYTVSYSHTPNVETTSGESVITNKLAATGLAGTKTWDDDSNRFGIRPDGIDLVIKQDGAAMDPQPEIEWAKDGDIWRWNAAGLPKENAAGADHTYTVEEKEVAGYDSSQTGFDFVNVLRRGALAVEKSQVGGSDTGFIFRVKLRINGTDRVYTGDYKVLASDAAWTEAGEVRQTDGAGAITIRRNQKFVITGLPAGAVYTITEDPHSRYYISGKSGDQGTVPLDTAAEAVFTNRYSSGSGGGTGGGGPTTPPVVIEENPIPLADLNGLDDGRTAEIEEFAVPLGELARTGDTSLPYALLFSIMLGAAGMLTAVVIKRRKEEEQN